MEEDGIIEEMEQKGTLRRLTSGEIAMGRNIFANGIIWHKVWVHCDSYFTDYRYYFSPRF